MTSPATLFWIALGSALGGVARFVLSGLTASALGQGFPWGTLLVNISGSFVIGLFAALAGPDGRPLVTGDLRLFVMVGLCGGYTTFSAFSLQTLTLAQDGHLARAGINIAASLGLCLLAVWLGWAAGAAFSTVKGA